MSATSPIDAPTEIGDGHPAGNGPDGRRLGARLRKRIARRHSAIAQAPLVAPDRESPFIDSFLFLLAICAMILPTSAGYSIAIAAAESVVGLPFALLMFFSPFALMALLPLRLLHLALDGFFGIRLRLGLLAPLALVSLAIFLFLGPLSIRPAPTPMALPADIEADNRLS